MPKLIPINSSLSLSQIGSKLISNTILKIYSTRISRYCPAYFVFFLDQSNIMCCGWDYDSDKSKTEIVADFKKNAFDEIIIVFKNAI